MLDLLGGTLEGEFCHGVGDDAILVEKTSQKRIEKAEALAQKTSLFV